MVNLQGAENKVTSNQKSGVILFMDGARKSKEFESWRSQSLRKTTVLADLKYL